MEATFIDLSHAVEDGMITHPGLPGPRVEAFLSRADSRKSYAPGTEFHIGRIEMVANTGTYVDAPFHRFSSGKDLAELPLTSLANLPGVMFRHDLQQGCGVGPGLFQGVDLAGKAVLIETGWSAHWGTPRYLEANPFLPARRRSFCATSGPRW